MRRVMKWFLFLFTILSLQLNAYGLRLLYAQDKIVAVVNNDIITQKDLSDFLNFLRMQLARQYEGKELEKQVAAAKPDLINKLIDDKLILQEARRTGLKADESRVKAKISEIKKRYGSDIEFQKDIARQGIVQADLEEKFREQFMMFGIIEMKVRSKVVVRPEEVTAYYNGHPNDILTPEVRMITAITLENQDQADTFSYSLKAGQKLDDLVLRYPVTLNKLEVKQGEALRKDIEKVVFKLGLGEVSDPVKIDDQYYVFKLDDLIPPRKPTLTEAQDKIENFLSEQKMQGELNKWLDDLKNKSYIKIIQN
ncbi:MAG: peptidyl-prolyl cis-trans isomerase [Candidatus Omnitrophica bacterium]|nr:peptidyl-prolyl cis-trans isomerase [Candidatus Omnitrophota bacterium]